MLEKMQTVVLEAIFFDPILVQYFGVWPNRVFGRVSIDEVQEWVKLTWGIE